MRLIVVALTKEYKETVVNRIRKDPKFTAALFSEAIAAFLEEDRETAFSILRDLVHARISFVKLARETGFDEKALHRMLSAKGNPTTRNFFKIIHVIKEDLNLSTNIKTRQVT